MTRGIVRTVARWLVGVLLFAQMAIAAYACPGLASALSGDMQRRDAGATPTTMTTPMVNCDAMAGVMDPMHPMDPASPNLCAEYCKYGQQSDHAATLVVPAVVLFALYASPLEPEAPPPSRPAAATLSALVAASPPHAVLHCVYRI